MTTLQDLNYLLSQLGVQHQGVSWDHFSSGYIIFYWSEEDCKTAYKRSRFLKIFPRNFKLKSGVFRFEKYGKSKLKLNRIK